MNTVDEREIVRLDDSAIPQRPSVRVAMNAITEAAPKFGSRVYLWELASALAKTDGVDLVLLVGQGQTNEIPSLLRSRAQEMSFPTGRSYRQIFQQKQIRDVLLLGKMDIYHIPNTIPLLGRAVPTVVTIHALDELRVKRYGVLRTAYRFLVNFLAAHLADRVLTVSENSKRDIVRLLRIPESKVTVVYNGVSEEFRPLDRKECKDYLASKYSIRGDFLLAPGGLSRNKNIPRLLAAMRLLKDRGRRESLVLLGDTQNPEFKYVAVSVRLSRLDGTVQLPGFVPREDLPAFYNAASLVVYPTLYEGFGLPVLEAMACGTPVVTSNNSSLPEVAGDAALLVNPRNPEEIAVAVQRLLADEALRTDLSSRGILHARQFTWKKAAEKTLEVFFELAARKERFRDPAEIKLTAAPGKRWLSRIRKLLSVRRIFTSRSFTPRGRLDALRVVLALTGKSDESYFIRLPVGKIFVDGRDAVIDFRVILQVLLAEVYDKLHLADRIVIDVGAHKGYFAAYALMANARAVWCYEPELANFTHLSRFAESAQNEGKAIQVVRAAVGDSDGEVILYKSHESWGHTTLPNPNVPQGEQERVRSCSLTSILSDARKAFPGHEIVLKIDAEGAECPMLMNTPVESLASVKEIAFEYHSFSQCELQDILGRLTPNGFQHFPSVKDLDAHFLLSREPTR